MKIALIIFPGANRDKDMQDALTACDRADVQKVFHKETSLPKGLGLIVLPGGFSYGDHLRTGAIAAHSPIMRAVCDEAKRGVRIVGICNGFQILCEAGLLPGALTRNRSARFVCDFVNLRVENNKTPFTWSYSPSQVIRIPIAHAEGNYYAPTELLKQLNNEEQVLFRYCSAQADIDEASNPNGSCDNIAGIANSEGNVFGFMPHPENACFAHQQSQDGKGIFASLSSDTAAMLTKIYEQNSKPTQKAV